MLPILAVVVGGLLALSGCGGSKGSSSSPSESQTPAATTTTQSSTAAPSTAPSSVSLDANSEGQLKYDKSALSAKAGQVAIDFTNSSPLSHNVTIESSSGSTVGATPSFTGGSKTLTLNLKSGTYKFYCSIPGHRAAGMEGTLTVK